MEDENLLLAIEQTIDALTFAQTHVVDNDFRAHSRATIDSVLSLQEEQRSRVDASFRALPASPQFLASQLLQAYRGEAASIALQREGGDTTSEGVTAIDDMPDHQCKLFKKEMKQRIHEWEGSFRDSNGREAAPQDKVLLRPIYELYKHAKNRVLRVESGATAPRSSMQPSQAQQPATTANPPINNLYTPVALSTPGRSSGSFTSGPQTTISFQQPTPERTSAFQMVSPMVKGSPVGGYPVTSVGGNGYGQHAYQQQQQPTIQSQGAIATTAAVQLTSSASQEPPLEDLIQEKRRIKRLLHHFESNFEQKFGKKPTKDDRKEYSREYHRYGELKALLNEHAKAGED